MPQPHATILSGATTSHHHSQSQSQSQSQPQSQFQSQPSYSNGGLHLYPPRSTAPSTNNRHHNNNPPRYPPAGVSVGAPLARSESVSHSRSSTPVNFSHRGPAANFHYNRGRSGTAGSIGGVYSGRAYGHGHGHGSVVGFSATGPGSETAGPRSRKGSRTTNGDSIAEDQPRAPEDQPLTFAEEAPSSPSFFAGTLPRTSSLLPPPRHLGSGPARAPPVTVDANANFNFNVIAEQDPAVPLGPDPANQQPRRSHSRGSSIGALSDSFRNLNRWSASTTSSRASHQVDRDQQQQLLPAKPTNNFSRRMSVDSVALLNPNTGSPQPTFQSPKKLTKRRPSAASITTASPRAASAASTRTRPHSPPPVPPPPNLPPIVSLPSLELSTSLTAPSPIFNRPSPAASTPTSIFSSAANGEPKDYFWDELANQIPASAGNTQGTTPGLLPAATVTRETAMPEKGHTRSRSSTAKSSTDSGRAKSKQPSQKAMLSKALAKANTAVQLDNAQNFEGARSSYTEACELLAQVLARTTGDEDKKKLEAIRRTYTSRIEELDGMVPVEGEPGSKALPARPESLAYNGVEVRPASDDEEQISPTTTRRLGPQPHSTTIRTRGRPTTDRTAEPAQLPLQSSFSSRSPMRRNFEGSLTIPSDNGQLMPAPLSPRRPLSPAKPMTPDTAARNEYFAHAERLATGTNLNGHARNPSHESISWLDPIDESGGSAASSIRSRSSSFGAQRKHLRAPSGDTEAEFDAALDAAVEAAYDEGFEPMDSYGEPYHGDEHDDDDIVANAMRRVEIAKERVRQTERETQFEREAVIRAAQEKERQRQLSIGGLHRDSQTYNNGHFYDGTDSDDEERMLEDLTRDYALNNFSFGQQPRKTSDAVARERESDSSGLTQRTWHSSIGSSPPTATTVLSSVAEMPPPMSKPPPSLPPPPQSLPQIPPPQPPGTPSGVRSRRLSGQNPKQLKIETAPIGQAAAGPSGATTAMPAKQGSFIAQQRQALSATTGKPGSFSMRVPGSPSRGVSPAPPLAPPTPPQNPPHTDDPNDHFRTGSPSPFGGALRKNQSSSSLKSLKTRQLSVSNIDNTSDLSPNTPLSQSLTNSSMRHPSVPALPTPLVSTFGNKATGGFGGLYLFESDFHSPFPQAQHSPIPAQFQGPDVPVPLEPCPSDTMLRPFWLMRALYQSIAHPRGGYITSRLFIPRDVWKVKGVKLRALEDKSSQCDLLTAALLKLARVDSNDADAVLEEMQSLENILEQVQQTLTRKLGNEVGIQGAGALREREDSEPTPPVPRSASISGKTASFSWRRLRSKGSAANLTSAYGNKSTSGGATERIAEKEIFGAGSGTLPSLPMVAHPSSRPVKRDVTSIKYEGPYAGYMQSLARLFDAAQTVDMIARQVEDPGLRHADKTQVGLELCTRHAAEFFGFYICRFVLADMALLLDKFVKRGSEWVLT
ncbi:uncharacterized protein JN550_007469 [Neoarthrinium moseri]|uniref:uncharacterized protein n=1 Tax=Neoarthrinium moseri TaxID=1658444 RepID=UPI001FDB0EB8|nr:uncharacterized protein JN550_007469 [Neoarthrinium moseri]KAI1866616.1 hypothetical protein JN550_007469 [Neoarthrinium moseri]